MYGARRKRDKSQGGPSLGARLVCWLSYVSGGIRIKIGKIWNVYEGFSLSPNS